MADQLGAHVLDRDADLVTTPHLDRLRESAARFDRAYVPFPLCVPSRASILTGRMPHELGVTGNAVDPEDGEPGARGDSLGRLLGAAGYDCAFAGKWHATQPSAPPDAGFDVLRPFGDAGLADACADWLRTRTCADAPFLLVASFDDPHTICEHARRQPMPYGGVGECDVRDAPPLPPNFEPAPYEAEAVRYEKSRAAHRYGTEDYTPDEWRSYRAAYRRLVERVDAYIGRLLDALDEAGLADSTLVVFTSDHGDGDAAHRWNQKTALFEECVRVPLVVAGPDVVPGTRHDLASVGLDLLPTLLNAAGVSEPAGLAGVPLELHRAPAGPAGPGADRSIVVETCFERPDPPITRGRAVYRGCYKYAVYSWGRHREQLHDLDADPGERRNLAVESAFDDVLEEMRGELLAQCLATDDRGFLKSLVLPRDADPALHGEIFATPY